MSEPAGQGTRWRNPVVANATGVPNTTSIRSGWARSSLIPMTWSGVYWSTWRVSMGTFLPAGPGMAGLEVSRFGGQARPGIKAAVDGGAEGLLAGVIEEVEAHAVGRVGVAQAQVGVGEGE